MALQGAGIVLKSLWDVAADLKAGRLQQVLPPPPPLPRCTPSIPTPVTWRRRCGASSTSSPNVWSAPGGRKLPRGRCGHERSFAALRGETARKQLRLKLPPDMYAPRSYPSRVDWSLIDGGSGHFLRKKKTRKSNKKTRCAGNHAQVQQLPHQALVSSASSRVELASMISMPVARIRSSCSRVVSSSLPYSLVVNPLSLSGTRIDITA